MYTENKVSNSYGWLNIQCSSRLNLNQINSVYLIRGFSRDNLFFGRFSDVEYFIIINKIYPPNLTYLDNFKNFKFEYFDSIQFDSKNTNTTIEKFLMVSFLLENIDLAVLYDALEDYTTRNVSQNFLESDIRTFLISLSDIVEKYRIQYSEILGCWGELFFILFLLEDIGYTMSEVLDSWESPIGRQLHDFKFINKKLLLEVKTTSNSTDRRHEFMALNQVEALSEFTGFLVSIKVNQDSISGLSCFDLQNKIIDKYCKDSSILAKFSRAKKVRGEKLLNDQSYKFSEVSEEALKLIAFHDVPKPICDSKIINVSWVADCDQLPVYLPSKLFV
jgi:hypothetical protein